MTEDKRGYSWPPFEAGHELSTTHGARSPRRLEPRAALVLEQTLADDGLAYLQQPAYAATLANWCRAQAALELFSEWLFVQPLEAQLKPPRGGTRSPLEVWGGMLKTSTGLADRLGLTPLARARLGRDVVAAEALAASTLDQIKERGRRSSAPPDADGSQ